MKKTLIIVILKIVFVSSIIAQGLEVSLSIVWKKNYDSLSTLSYFEYDSIPFIKIYCKNSLKKSIYFQFNKENLKPKFIETTLHKNSFTSEVLNDLRKSNSVKSFDVHIENIGSSNCYWLIVLNDSSNNDALEIDVINSAAAFFYKSKQTDELSIEYLNPQLLKEEKNSLFSDLLKNIKISELSKDCQLNLFSNLVFLKPDEDFISEIDISPFLLLQGNFCFKFRHNFSQSVALNNCSSHPKSFIDYKIKLPKKINEYNFYFKKSITMEVNFKSF
jgi:hypothetical protein